MIVGQIYFWLLAALSVIGALVTVGNRNPIRGAMGLLLMIVSLAGLFLALHAEFLAFIQLIVYAGAIVVLFIFVIMLLGPSATSPRDHRGRTARTIGGVVFGLAAVGALFLAWRGSNVSHLQNVPGDFGSVDAIGQTIFSVGLVPFELSSALLMIAVVGAVAIARGRQGHEGAIGRVDPGSIRSGAMIPGVTLKELAETPDPRKPLTAEIGGDFK